MSILCGLLAVIAGVAVLEIVRMQRAAQSVEIINLALVENLQRRLTRAEVETAKASVDREWLSEQAFLWHNAAESIEQIATRLIIWAHADSGREVADRQMREILDRVGVYLKASDCNRCGGRGSLPYTRIRGLGDHDLRWEKCPDCLGGDSLGTIHAEGWWLDGKRESTAPVGTGILEVGAARSPEASQNVGEAGDRERQVGSDGIGIADPAAVSGILPAGGSRSPWDGDRRRWRSRGNASAEPCQDFTIAKGKPAHEIAFCGECRWHRQEHAH